ncbi:hypothetical protein D3C87_1863180 [compost metagenome]
MTMGMTTGTTITTTIMTMITITMIMGIIITTMRPHRSTMSRSHQFRCVAVR